MTKAHDLPTGSPYARQINRARLSSTWLSGDMAEALAATVPALACSDVMRAADQLTLDCRPSEVTNDLLQCGADLQQAGRVIEALLALRDIA